MWHRHRLASHHRPLQPTMFAIGVAAGIITVALIADAKDIYKFLKYIAMSR